MFSRWDTELVKVSLVPRFTELGELGLPALADIQVNSIIFHSLIPPFIRILPSFHSSIHFSFHLSQDLFFSLFSFMVTISLLILVVNS